MRTTGRRTLALSLLLLGASAPVAGAQGVKSRRGEFTCWPERPGTFAFTPTATPADFGATAAQGRALMAHIEAIKDHLASLPVFNPPRGIDVRHVYGDFCCPHYCRQAGDCRTRPMYGRLWVLLEYWHSTGSGPPVTFVEHRSELEMLVNHTFMFEHGDLPRLANGRHMGWEPTPWREVNGVTLYRVEGGDLHVVLAHGERPLWLPVTKEELAAALLRERGTDHEESVRAWQRPEVLATAEGRAMAAKASQQLGAVRELLLGPLERRLAAMSPDERRRQARIVSPGDPDPFAREDAPEARGLVRVNPAYFDRARPRTDVQLLVARLEGIPAEGPKAVLDHCSDVSDARLWQLVQEIDWRRLARLVRPAATPATARATTLGRTGP